jgi:hypothetical protein
VKIENNAGLVDTAIRIHVSFYFEKIQAFRDRINVVCLDFTAAALLSESLQNWYDNLRCRPHPYLLCESLHTDYQVEFSRLKKALPFTKLNIVCDFACNPSQISKQTGEMMTVKFSGIRFIPGSTDNLIVAPHGPVIDGEYQNDLRTGIIAEEIQQNLGCCAIINDRFFKPTVKIPKSLENYLLDLFRIDHGKKVPGYLDRIKEVVDSNGKTMVVWVHGIADKVAIAQGQEHIAQGYFSGEPTELHALIGYGQGKDPKTGETQDRLSALVDTVEAFRKQLTAGGMTTLLTHKEGSNFRGRDAKRLNQWFNHLGYGFDQVESIQLEIKEKGFRDSKQNALKAAMIIAKALSSLTEPGQKI